MPAEPTAILPVPVTETIPNKTSSQHSVPAEEIDLKSVQALVAPSQHSVAKTAPNKTLLPDRSVVVKAVGTARSRAAALVLETKRIQFPAVYKKFE
jgi:hypothetical protein